MMVVKKHTIGAVDFPVKFSYNARMTNHNNFIQMIDDGPYYGLWLDDLRPLPTDWCGPQFDLPLDTYWWTNALNFHEAILLLERCPIRYVSLDHDIASFYGNKEMSGFDVLWWLVDRKVNRPDECQIEWIKVHSANSSAKPKMLETVDKYWSTTND